MKKVSIQDLKAGLSAAVSELVEAAQRGAQDDLLRGHLMRLVPDYQPAAIINDPSSNVQAELPKSDEFRRIPLSP